MRHTAPITFAIALSGLTGSAASLAQSTGNAAYAAAVAEHRWGDAADMLRDRLSRPPAAHPSVRASYARMLLLAGRREEAHAAAEACVSDADRDAAEFCAAVLRESAPPAPRLAPAAPAEPPPREAPRPLVLRPVVSVSFASTRRTWTPTAGPVAMWSVGAAALVAAGVLATLRDDALAGCTVTGDNATCRDAASLERARGSVNLTTAANVSAAVGATALVAGTTWWLLGGRSVVPVVSPDGVYVALAGRLP